MPFFEYFNTTTPVARKNYCCDWCSEVIEKGTKYFKCVGTLDGDWQTNRIHIECHEAYLSLSWLDQEDAFDFAGDYARGSVEERMGPIPVSGQSEP